MKGVQCYELFGGIAHKIHTSFFFSFSVCLYNASFFVIDLCKCFLFSCFAFVYFIFFICIMHSAFNLFIFPNSMFTSLFFFWLYFLNISYERAMSSPEK